MLEKVILVHYINVGNKSPQRAKESMSKMIQVFKDSIPDEDKEKIISYFIPVTNSETRVECIYPHKISVNESDMYTDSYVAEKGEKDLAKLFNIDFSTDPEVQNIMQDWAATINGKLDTLPSVSDPFLQADMAMSKLVDELDAIVNAIPTKQSYTIKGEKELEQAKATVAAALKPILERYSFKINTEQTRNELRRDIETLLGPVPEKVAELHTILSDIRKEKNELVQARSYENAARLRDKEKNVLATLEAVQAVQLIPYSHFTIESDQSYPARIKVTIFNGDISANEFGASVTK